MFIVVPRALFALAVIAMLPVASASAASRSTVPKITSVAPMKLGVGDVLTIRGTNFRSGSGRNSVIFKRVGGRAVFVKAGAATRTRIKVRVPTGFLEFLPSSGGKATAARFRLRVLAKSFSRGYTRLGISPTISPADADAGSTGPGGKPPVAPAPAVPPDCDADGTPDATDGDDDNDMLTDALEIAIATALCNADSDGDGAATASSTSPRSTSTTPPAASRTRASARILTR